MSSSTTNAIMSRVSKLLYGAEIFFLGMLTVAILLTKFDFDSSVLILIAVAGLGLTFFINAFRQLDIPKSESERPDFKDMLFLTIIPKVLWIGSAVATFGILFFLLELAPDSYTNLLMIGSAALVIALLISSFFILTNHRHSKIILPIVYRAIPVVLISGYILFS